MKKINKILAFSVAVLVLVGCTESFEEINTKPDVLLADNLDIGLLGQAFANGQMRAMTGAPGGGAGNFQLAQSLFSDIYSQYFANTATNFDSDRHIQVGGWSNGLWNYFYAQAAPIIKFVEDFTEVNEMPVENAFAKILKVQAYHRYTDYFGPIIYTEFGNAQTTVQYDTQEFIYRDFFRVLDEAVDVLKQHSGGQAFTAHDQVFGGSADRWLTFANSLRLRLAMRVKYVDPQLSRTEAEKAVADGVMMNNDDNAAITTTINSRHPYWTITDWGEFRMSALMENILVGFEDPRLSIYFRQTDDYMDDDEGQPYRGLRNGLPRGDLDQGALNRAFSDLGVRWLNQGRGGSAAGPPFRMMCSAEVFFLRAEGALEGWNMGGTAQELYERGVELSMTESRIGADGDAVQAYLSSTNSPAGVTYPEDSSWDLGPSSNIPIEFQSGADLETQLEQIITQKWLALFPDGWEAWAELRRTKYPRPYPRVASDNVDVPRDQVMSRLIFVEGEYDNNRAAVEAAQELPELTSRGGDRNSTRLWWDAKP
ncbi:SusD/RagB family nutrient-binding outer membrane lipoprotein [Pleomorphovibrio marinus]|uniref:SusD/RagB family nutrient-binding outer membrane lipoprotein n=1 Tax=Pleomorphovibrio marinus TaxID=2164132 RepID=UPI000E0B737A|nr:SusD/RagB family nutrient-binding outer membrane lipoprotein [Pleomorphovibrio marinus]